MQGNTEIWKGLRAGVTASSPWPPLNRPLERTAALLSSLSVASAPCWTFTWRLLISPLSCPFSLLFLQSPAFACFCRPPPALSVVTKFTNTLTELVSSDFGLYPAGSMKPEDLETPPYRTGWAQLLTCLVL